MFPSPLKNQSYRVLATDDGHRQSSYNAEPYHHPTPEQLLSKRPLFGRKENTSQHEKRQTNIIRRTALQESEIAEKKADDYSEDIGTITLFLAKPKKAKLIKRKSSLEMLDAASFSSASQLSLTESQYAPKTTPSVVKFDPDEPAPLTEEKSSVAKIARKRSLHRSQSWINNQQGSVRGSRRTREFTPRRCTSSSSSQSDRMRRKTTARSSSFTKNIEYNDSNRLLGLLGPRKHKIFGDVEPEIESLESLTNDDSWNLDNGSFNGKQLSDEASLEEARKNQQKIDDREYDRTRRTLSKMLLQEHEVFLTGKRSTFIEVQPFAHEDPNRKPKFSLPFSPVKGSTYGIVGDDDGDLVSVHSDNMPDDNESCPGSRPSSAARYRAKRQPRGSNSPGGNRKPRVSITMNDGNIVQMDDDDDDDDDGDDDKEEEEDGEFKSKPVRQKRRTARDSINFKEQSPLSKETRELNAIGSIHGENFSRKQKETYFGHRARKDFFYKYQEVARRAQSIPDREVLASAGRSPRSEYLAEINAKGLLPWPVLLRSMSSPKVVDLTSMGLGDEVIKSLTTVLDKLPNCDTLLLADNRLTDDSLLELCEKVTQMHSLTHLDISYNKMDEASKIILNYLVNPHCDLKVLVMEHSDIDDFECGDLMDALKVNKSLRSLDLQDNLLGEKEQLNVVMPELLTGGEAVGEMLTVNKYLTELDVSWNSIRGDSAQELAECLESNTTLKTLCMSHNAFGDVPSQTIGDVLSRNMSITHLDMSFNSVSPAAAMVIANAFNKNVTVEILMLNGNNIGRRGAESLMQALRRNKREDGHLLIQINNCDCEFEDASLFDPVEPANNYNLDMTLPYSRMVASELLRMANERPGAYFKSVKYSKDLKFDHGWQPIELQQGDGGVDADGSQCVDFNETRIAMSLLAIRVSDDEVKRIIAEFDIDKSGEIEEDEFVSWMINCYARQKEPSKPPVRHKGQPWVPPDSGTLVIDFKADRLPPAENEIGSDVGIGRLIFNIENAESDAERAKLFDKATANSDIYMTAAQAQQLMEISAKGEEIQTIQKLLPQMSDPQQCSQLVNKNLSLRQALYLRKNLGPSFGVIMGNATGRYVLDMENEIHRTGARKIAELNNFEKRFSRTKSGRGDTSQKGNWENFRNETFNGKSIKLDSNWFTKIPHLGKLKVDYVSTTRAGKAAKPLSERRFSTLMEKLKMEEVDEIRQWYNEYNALEHQKEVEDARKMEREAKNQEAIREKRELDSIKLRGGASLTSATQEQLALERAIKRKSEATTQSTPALDALSRTARKAGFFDDDVLKKGGSFSGGGEVGEEDGEGAEEMGVQSESVGHRIQSRRKGIDATLHAPKNLLAKVSDSNKAKLMGLAAFSSGLKRQGSKKRIPAMQGKGKGGSLREKWGKGKVVEEDDESSDDEGFYDDSGVRLKFNNSFDVPEFMTWIEATNHYKDFLESSNKMFNYYGQEVPRDGSKSSSEIKLQEEQEIKEKLKNKKPLRAYLHLYCKLQELEVAVMGCCLTCRQASTIIDHFPRRDYARVQATVCMHKCLYDLENFNQILRMLDADESREVIHRLGYLNTWNPWIPDATYKLDLRAQDHRKMTEMLSILEQEEPGENWLDATYRWSVYDGPVPGWELPKSWSGRKEDTDNAGNCGPRDFGRLGFEYTSDPILGCAPVWAVRRELKKLCLMGGTQVH
ncbi:hypothetical protein TL16_g07497 [Triparma laevis f. inornata]|uniref:EF-hand domain-containing protein n=1 Tax=Triparma laevis f. inornata TaxID=1714386 RepID=A0A9W7AZ70_9STRA|nr:hypothetical protein TL16_g07497 [Triparma laevis f. inornata]